MARHCVHAALARCPDPRPLFFKGREIQKYQASFSLLHSTEALQLHIFIERTLDKEENIQQERERAVAAGTKQSNPLRNFLKQKKIIKNTHKKKKDKRIFFPFQGRSFYFINSQFCNWKALVPIKYRNCSFFSVC